jgi:hypothetical protein
MQYFDWCGKQIYCNYLFGLENLKKNPMRIKNKKTDLIGFIYLKYLDKDSKKIEIKIKPGCGQGENLKPKTQLNPPQSIRAIFYFKLTNQPKYIS